MSTLKTKIDSDEVLRFLRARPGSEIESLETISGGELSQAFAFVQNGAEYVIRINTDIAGFEKDKYAFEHFASKDIPIPRTVDLGQFTESLYFSITERMPGWTLESFSSSDVLQMTNSIITTLDAIHAMPIMGEGFGDWDLTGEAGDVSWRTHLLELLANNDRDLAAGTHGDFLDQHTVEQLTEKFVSLVKYCPETRQLIHADFESSNTLADGTRVTGVIDWGNSKYGDPLFDIAWIDFWNEAIGYKKIFYEHRKRTGENLAHYDERILCYQLYFGIGALFFFTKSHQESSYRWTEQKLRSLTRE